MEARLVDRDSFDSGDSFGTVLTFEIDDEEQGTATLEVILGYSAYAEDEESEEYTEFLPFITTIWEGAVDRDYYVDTALSFRDLEAGIIPRGVGREMRKAVDELIRDYPELRDYRDDIMRSW